MIPKNELFDEIMKYCFDKKIVFEMLMQGDMNSASVKNVDGKVVFEIIIVNERDKNLNNIVKKGFEDLKKLNK